jgi:hypothetical protein
MSTQERPPAEAEREAELAIIRRTYAKHVLANAEVDDALVEAAFAAVRREDFLGPGPGRCCAGRAIMYRRRAMIRSICIRTR